MKPFARLVGIGSIGLVGFGLYAAGTGSVNPIDDLLDALPKPDNRAQFAISPGQRLAFDEPLTWEIAAGQVMEVERCDGIRYVVTGRATVDQVCALTPLSQ